MDYIYLAIALFAVGLLGRYGLMVYRNSAGVPEATFEALSSGMVRATIWANPLESWAPGQHFFFAFFACAPFASHPFTVVSIPSPGSTKRQKIVLLIREQAGLTRKLRKAVAGFESSKGTPVLLDGPYGGIMKTSLAKYEHVLLVAGGSGISFVVPLLLDLARHMRCPSTLCKSVHLVWSIKDEGGPFCHCSSVL
jgi:predicted ferric reductase